MLCSRERTDSHGGVYVLNIAFFHQHVQGHVAQKLDVRFRDRLALFQ